MRADWCLLVEALSGRGVSDDGVFEVTERNVWDNSLGFAKKNPHWDSAGPVTGTSLTHQLGVIDLLHTEKAQPTGSQNVRDVR